MSGCFYNVQPPQADNIAFYFNYFDTESGKDELKIYDGNTTQLLTILSGFYSPGNVPDPILCEFSSTFLSFSSDVYLNGSGWEIYYDTSSVLKYPPKNVQIENDIYEVTVYWDPPTTGSLILEGYNMYRDGEQINTTILTNTEYSETMEYDTYNYCVTALYTENESQYVCNSIIVPCYGGLEVQFYDDITGIILENVPFILDSLSCNTGIGGVFNDILPEDDYLLIAEIPGYWDVDSIVSVPCDDTIAVDILLYPTLPSPDSLFVEVISDSLIQCSWLPPDTSGFYYSLIGFNIYRNDTLLNSSPHQDATFNDTGLFNGQFQYCVTSVYDIAESLKTCDSVINYFTGQIEGFVRNSYTSDPIEDAILTIESYADTTNQNGYFLLQDIPIGLHDIMVSADNFELLELNQVDINYGMITNLQVELYPLYLYTPENLQYSFNSNILELDWTEPQASPWILQGYNIYFKTQNSVEYEQLNEEIIEETSFIDSEYIFSEKTFYYVTAIYNAGESDSSNTVLVDFGSVNENKTEYIKIYPNPSNGIFNVYFKSPIVNGDISIEVHSLKGDKLLNKDFKNENNPLIINLSEFKKGIYLLFIQEDGINATEKIIIF